MEARMGNAAQNASHRRVTTCHHLADRSFQAVYYAEQAHHAYRIGQTNRVDSHILQVQVIQAEVGGGSSWVQASAGDLEVLSACECVAHVCFHNGLLPAFVRLTLSLSPHKSSVWRLKIRRQN